MNKYEVEDVWKSDKAKVILARVVEALKSHWHSEGSGGGGGCVMMWIRSIEAYRAVVLCENMLLKL